ncbi:MAG: UDP-N-acetylmuramoyl-L-alanyl-D-glutamate--2,6-diaminopimelate ligase [Gammaproteobacteria bacterium]
MSALAERSAELRLGPLLAGFAEIPAERDVPVQGLALDSRAVHAGYLFLALRGHDHHGLKHLAEARTRGARAVAYDPAGADAYLPVPAGLPAFPVSALGEKTGYLAARFYADPSAHARVVAVTGTSGKTSVAALTAQLLTGLGRPCGLIGTLGYGVYGTPLAPAPYTTPDAVQLQAWLARFRDRQVRHVSMEASSHALDQGRLNGVQLRAAAFTNLSRDHLDYHGTLAAYAAAKRRLFELPGLAAAVVNLDDAFGRELAAALAADVQLFGYTLESSTLPRGRVLSAGPLSLHAGGMRFEVQGDYGAGTVETTLLGRFNVYNLLAVLGLLLALDVPFGAALAALGTARTVPGRMQCFGGGAGAPLVVVDYAHKPDALEKALTAARTHCQGELWCVFGCGGERDRGKRPQMAAIAERLADHVIVTDDNPRHEDGDVIVQEILAGLHAAGKVQVERERARAIAAAISAAASGDVVLVAGKGHETYQLVGDRRMPFSDTEVVVKLLAEVQA